MALPTRQDLKDVLKIETTAEDTLIDGMLTRALALMVGYLGRPYEATERTWVDDAGNVRAYRGITSLMVPTVPFDPESLVIEDADGTSLVVTTDYRAPQPWDAVIRAAVGTTFSNPPYRITADVGLSASTWPDYVTVIEPVLSQAVIDTVADWYQRRSPNASSESTGGGVSTSWQTSGLPARVTTALSQWAAVRVV